MSDKMRGLSFTQLLDRMEAEYARSKTVFGVKPHTLNNARPITMFGERLDCPFGAAAGPHTQLAQNIAAAYVAGCRYFELKTVQILDGNDLPVKKPCIFAEDEGYNVEWSTELTVSQAFDEYVKAWFILKLLSLMSGGDGKGFIFNMSVGYDLASVQSPKLERFIEGMKNASDTNGYKTCLEEVCRRYPHYAEFFRGMSPQICGSVTISTLHGCPAFEIERIAQYLICQKRLNTFIKCNPTLLGYDDVRNTLDSMGYSYISFDKRHFNDDLQFSEAASMFSRLTEVASANGLEFGVKLTNTFPVDIIHGELPGDEMYMSGKALYPLAVAVAAKLSLELNGKLRISYSGGADAGNIAAIAETGIYPITVATTLLKPGGYARCKQLADILSGVSIKPTIDREAIRLLQISSQSDSRYKKPIKLPPARRIAKKPPLFDCFIAPCAYGCPFGQDIPEYVRLIEQGKYEDALLLITQKNPLPFITGSICAHPCMDSCTRNHYDEPVCIRSLKLAAAQEAFEYVINKAVKPQYTDKRIAVIGGGPAGLAVAYLLGKRGVCVTLFEKSVALGGVVRNAIPEFRIPGEYIERDIALATRFCKDVRLNTVAPPVGELIANDYDGVVIAIGAGKRGALDIAGTVINGLDFLSAHKRGEHILPKGNICVIGGGNTAMDAARAALREDGVLSVSIVYRRTKRYMPASTDELSLAMSDGVRFYELLSPLRHENGILYCERMELGAIESTGRKSVTPTGETVCIPCSAIIAAVGEGIDDDYFNSNGIASADEKPDYFTSIDGVYRIGDCRNGAATIAQAIADAHNVVEAILGSDEYRIMDVAYPHYNDALKKRGIVQSKYNNASDECRRCLSCSTVCENCVDVCPNRANIPISVAGKRMRQILHIEQLCNECGNCAVFCPYNGMPYRDKLTLFCDEASLRASANPGFCVLDPLQARILIRLDGCVKEVYADDCQCIEPAALSVVSTVIRSYSELL